MVTKSCYHYLCVLVSVCQAALVYFMCACVLILYSLSCVPHVTGTSLGKNPSREAQEQRASSEEQAWGREVGSLCTFVRCILYSFFIFPVHIHVSLHWFRVIASSTIIRRDLVYRIEQ